MGSLFPLSVLRVPEKRAQKERVIAAPTLGRLRPAEPSPPSPVPSPRPAEPKPSAAAQARAILLAAQKRDGTISAADLKWLSNFHAPQRGEFESPAQRAEAEKKAKMICLVGEKRRGEISLADERRLADHFAEMRAIELLR
jgi:hypothetical protein